jgi:hypothetical protein
MIYMNNKLKPKTSFWDVTLNNFCPENVNMRFLQIIGTSLYSYTTSRTRRQWILIAMRSYSIEDNEIPRKTADISWRSYFILECSLPLLLRDVEQWAIETQDGAINACIVLRLSISLCPPPSPPPPGSAWGRLLWHLCFNGVCLTAA